MAEQSDDRWQYGLKQLGAGVALMVVALGVLSYNWRWVRSVLEGPLALGKDELRRIDNPAAMANPYIKVPYDEIVETDLMVVKQDKKNPNDHTRQTRFLLVRVQDSWLLAECSWYAEGKELIGYLDVWKDPLRKEAIERVRKAFPAQSQNLLSIHLDADFEYRGYCYPLMGGIGLAFLIAVGLVLGGVMSLLQGREHAVRSSTPARNRVNEDELPARKPKPMKRKRFRDDPDD